MYVCVLCSYISMYACMFVSLYLLLYVCISLFMYLRIWFWVSFLSFVALLPLFVCTCPKPPTINQNLHFDSAKMLETSRFQAFCIPCHRCLLERPVHVYVCTDAYTVDVTPRSQYNSAQLSIYAESGQDPRSCMCLHGPSI